MRGSRLNMGVAMSHTVENTKARFLIAGVLCVGFVMVSPASAQNPDWPTGQSIVEKVNARDEGEAVSRSVLMEMTDRRGKKRVRNTFGHRKYYGDEKRTVIFYQSPKNIKGTAFLTFDYPEAKKDDDQWLYLPAMRKVRRISAADRGDYFLGTDFSYEDIKKESKVTIEDYTWATIGEETLDGHECYVTEGIPVSKEIAKELGYGKTKAWVDKEIWMARKVDYWDTRGNYLKTNHITDIQNIQGIWTLHQMDVRNHKTGHHTRFSFSDIDYKSGVDDDVFTERALKRGR